MYINLCCLHLLINGLKTIKKFENAEKERLLTSNPISCLNFLRYHAKIQKPSFCSC